MSDSDGVPRLYQPIWSRLKALPANKAAKQGIPITAPRALHKRIIKAVIKEKWLDVVYKLSIEPLRARLYYTRSGSIITFYLVKYTLDSIPQIYDECDL